VVAGHLQRQFVVRPQFARKVIELLELVLAPVRTAVLQSHAAGESVPMQIDADKRLPSIFASKGELRGGVDVLSGGHQPPIQGPQWPYGGASATGLTNLLDGVTAPSNASSLQPVYSGSSLPEPTAREHRHHAISWLRRIVSRLEEQERAHLDHSGKRADSRLIMRTREWCDSAPG
jgi:hypothetical protein